MHSNLENTLLATILRRPRVTSDLLPRPRLLAHLNSGLEHQITIVSAPAGYGKTTLLCHWLETVDRPAAWLALEALDSDLAQFVTYFVAATCTLFPNAFPLTRALLQARQLPQLGYLAATITDEILDLPSDYILVLDDYHLIHEPQIHRLLATVIGQMPERMHLVISSRVDPLMPFSRLMAQGHISAIHARHLAFDVDETRAFLNRALPVDLSEQSIITLQARTEGWIAGLRLAALSMQDHSDPTAFIENFSGETNRLVIDFLMSEILEQQPPIVRTFLTRTCILAQFNSELCQEVTGLSEPQGVVPLILNALEHSNLFLIPLDNKRQWYRYHHLFRDLLRYRLSLELSEVEVKQLHTRASAWFAAHGLVDDAIRHALEAGDANAACAAVESNMHAALDREWWFELERWLGQLPADQVRQRPALVLAQAAVLHFGRFRHDTIPPLLDLASQLLESQTGNSPTSEQAELGAILETFRGLLLYHRSSIPDALDCFTRAAPAIAVDHHLFYSWTRMCATFCYANQGETRRAISLMEQGLAQPDQGPIAHERYMLGVLETQQIDGDLDGMLEQARTLAKFAEQFHLPSGTGWSHHMLGYVALERLELDAAVEHFELLRKMPQQVQFHIVREAVFMHALALQLLGNAARSNELVQQLLEIAIETHNPDLTRMCRAMQARLALLQGDLDRAERWAETRALPPDNAIPFYYVMPKLTHIRVLIHHKSRADLRVAFELIDERLQFVRRLHIRRWVLELLALQALALCGLNRHKEAFQALRQSLALGKPAGFVRPFVEAGPAMEGLLRALPPADTHARYVRQLFAYFPSPSKTARRVTKPVEPRERLVEPLTSRELDVLALLSQRRTDKEIASGLVISPLTVRKHITNIYQKLGAHNRQTALARAASLGLLPG